MSASTLNWIRTANVSPMKRLNRTRTNVIDRRQFLSGFTSDSRERDPLITVWLEVQKPFAISISNHAAFEACRAWYRC